jgi:hypothetical protein
MTVREIDAAVVAEVERRSGRQKTGGAAPSLASEERRAAWWEWAERAFDEEQFFQAAADALQIAPGSRVRRETEAERLAEPALVPKVEPWRELSEDEKALSESFMASTLGLPEEDWV